MQEFDEFDQEERQMCFDFNTERVDKQYYVDRTGRVRKYKGDMYAEITSMHYEIASAIFPDLDFPEDHVLKKLGWVLVGSSVYSHPITHKKISQKQIDTLFDLDLYSRLTILDGKHYINYESQNS